MHNFCIILNFIAEAEKVVGWAKNHYLSSCLLPSIKGERLILPRERYEFMLEYLPILYHVHADSSLSVWSLEIAIVRLKQQESISQKPSLNLKAWFSPFSSDSLELLKALSIILTSNGWKFQQSLAKDDYESNFVSAVVPPGEIGVKFDDIGALEDVKKALNELVILPMKRPELFSRGNLLRVVISFTILSWLMISFSVWLFFIFFLAPSLAKEYYFLGLLELGKRFLPKDLLQRPVQTSSA